MLDDSQSTEHAVKKSEKTLVVVGAGRGRDLAGIEFSCYEKVYLLEPQRLYCDLLLERFRGVKNISIIQKALVVEPVKSVSYKVRIPRDYSSHSEPSGICNLYPGIRVLSEQEVEKLCVSDFFSKIINKEIVLRLDCCGGEKALLESIFSELPSSSMVSSIFVNLAIDRADFADSVSTQDLETILTERFYVKKSTNDHYVHREHHFEYSYENYLDNQLKLHKKKASVLQANLAESQRRFEEEQTRFKLEKEKVSKRDKKILLRDVKLAVQMEKILARYERLERQGHKSEVSAARIEELKEQLRDSKEVRVKLSGQLDVSNRDRKQAEYRLRLCELELTKLVDQFQSMRKQLNISSDELVQIKIY